MNIIYSSRPKNHHHPPRKDIRQRMCTPLSTGF